MTEILGCKRDNGTVEEVTISQTLYWRLVGESNKLQALEAWGVDQWGGYEEAMRSLDEGQEEDDEKDDEEGEEEDDEEGELE